VIAAGAGHEIGKHRLRSDGVCAPGAGGRRRKAKNDCAGRKKLQKEEVRGDFVTRNQNKSTSIEQRGELKQLCFRRCCAPGAGRKAARPPWA
jgi:hypothetical protein